MCIRDSVVAARIQQLFGINDVHPMIQTQPIIFELLAPNNRMQQRSSNLPQFWKDSYKAIRKELRGRYPKHAWPEVPTRADAQNHPTRARKKTR